MRQDQNRGKQKIAFQFGTNASHPLLKWPSITIFFAYIHLDFLPVQPLEHPNKRGLNGLIERKSFRIAAMALFHFHLTGTVEMYASDRRERSLHLRFTISQSCVAEMRTCGLSRR